MIIIIDSLQWLIHVVFWLLFLPLSLQIRSSSIVSVEPISRILLWSIQFLNHLIHTYTQLAYASRNSRSCCAVGQYNYCVSISGLAACLGRGIEGWGAGNKHTSARTAREQQQLRRQAPAFTLPGTTSNSVDNKALLWTVWFLCGGHERRRSELIQRHTGSCFFSNFSSWSTTSAVCESFHLKGRVLDPSSSKD